MRPATSVATPPTESSLRPDSECPLLRVALLCDFLEEGWFSMDLFGDMLSASYQREHATEIAAEQVRPAFRRRLSRLPIRNGAGLLWNADRLINRFYEYPSWLKKQLGRFDLFHLMDHSYGQLIHELPRELSIATCHDLDTFRCLLEPTREPRPRWFRRMTQRTLDGLLRCSHIICDSLATRSQMLAYGLFPDHRISLIPPGVDPVFFAPPAFGPSRNPIDSMDPAKRAYLVHVGSTIRRKRIDLLLRIFASLVQEFPHLALVRVGGSFTPEQSQLAAHLGIDGKIVYTRRLSKEELAAVYQDAALLLQTSDAEGFGLPVVEAMACGCVVVASDIPALREAGGQAAEFYPTEDIQSCCAIVSRLLRERDTCSDQWEVRQDASRRHASAFTWSRNAARTVEVYRKVLQPAGTPPNPKL